jgi:hypothetical protein
MKTRILAVLMLLSVMACKNDKRVDDGVADVYVKTVLIDGVPAYGIAHYFLGYSSLTSVTVTKPDATQSQLSTYDNSFTLFYFEPSVSGGSFSATLPLQGTYTYNVKFDDGIEKTYSDQISGDYILPPTNMALAKSEDGQRVQVRWSLAGSLTDVYYRYTVLQNESVLFRTDPFTLKDPGNLYFEIPVYYFSSYPTGNYKIELEAIKYQSLSEGKIQSASSTSADIAF